MDPPDHTRHAAAVSGAFTPRAIAGLEPWIREVTVRLLTSADAAAGFDLIDALAFPLPIAVICHLLGVPAEDQAQLPGLGHAVPPPSDPRPPWPPEPVARCGAGADLLPAGPGGRAPRRS